MKVIHSFCSWKREISPHFFPLLRDAPSEDRNTSLSNNEEKLKFSNATLIASTIPLASWLLGNPRHSKKVNVSSMVSGSTKKMYATSGSVMLVSEVPSHNMAIKFTRKHFSYIFKNVYSSKYFDYE